MSDISKHRGCLSNYKELFISWIKKDIEHIPKKDMIKGRYYICKARNFKVGYWNGSVFEYKRTKFNTEFDDIEYHHDDCAPFGTARPLKIVE